ncbi:hypothetical protein [Luteimonas saliphila]|uniref:hypothetical protein n=1 Tax=Luteimonas saliphila TaxID=2804919 RepID=UPI00192D8A46|nr:hypothetical protein [Luteimonas saliphila]
MRPSFANVATVAPGDTNTFTGANGVTRRIQPAPAAAATPAVAQPPLLQPANVAAPPSNAPLVQQATARALEGQRGQTQTARADAASILNPMSADAEILRRLENSQGSYFHKGSPQARRLVGEAIAGQLGARNAASAQGQAAGNATLQQGAVGEGFAAEGAARRQIDASMFNADDGYRRQALAADIARPTLQADASGNLLSISGTTAAPVTGADGAGVQLAQPPLAGQITPAALLEAYSEQSRAINEGLGTPEEKVLQQQALRSDPMFGTLFAQQQPAGGASIPVGTERAGYRFKGGDPSNRASWERIK